MEHEKETAVALSKQETAIVQGFGGEDAGLPVEVSWPQIKMTKTDCFVMSDDSKVKELVGHIIFAKRSRAYYKEDFDGGSERPDCASSDLEYPDFGENYQSEDCKSCPKAAWAKDEKDNNYIDCKLCLNTMFLLEGDMLPSYIRIRSTSMHKGTPFSNFLRSCLDPKFALFGKFQTVLVKLTLNETKINNKETSILQAEKIKTLEANDEKIPVLLTLFNKCQEEFSVSYAEEAETDPPAVDEAKKKDDIPI